MKSSLGDDLSPTCRTTLTVENGKEGYKYRFLIRNNDTGKEWYAQKDYKTNNSVVWLAGPKSAKNGKTIIVDVIDAKGNHVDTIEKTVSVTDSDLKIEGITSSKGNTLGYKTRTTLSAKVTGGKAPYEYRFLIKNNDTNKEWLAQDYNTKDSVVWLAGPKGADKGKTIYVTVRDARGDTVSSALNVKVSNSDLEVVSITSSLGKTLNASDYTTLSATVKGGTSPYKYTFQVKNNDTGKWWTIQDGKTSSSCRWYAGPGAGSKTIFMTVEDKNGNKVTETLDVTVS